MKDFIGIPVSRAIRQDEDETQQASGPDICCAMLETDKAAAEARIIGGPDKTARTHAKRLLSLSWKRQRPNVTSTPLRSFHWDVEMSAGSRASGRKEEELRAGCKEHG